MYYLCIKSIWIEPTLRSEHRGGVNSKQGLNTASDCISEGKGSSLYMRGCTTKVEPPAPLLKRMFPYLSTLIRVGHNCYLLLNQ